MLTLEHGKANALDLELCERLPAALEESAAHARAAVITSAGPIFSAGVDLLRVLKEGEDYVTEFLTALNALCETVFAFRKPLVAAVNGHAIAGGCVLACMADWRIMSADAGRIGVPELLVGVPFPAGPLEVLRFSVPQRYLAEIIYGCETYTPTDARERGLVDEVVASDQLMVRAIEMAHRLSGVTPDAFRLTKALTRRPALERMRAAGDIDAEVRRLWTSEQTKVVIRDYVRKTFKKGDS